MIKKISKKYIYGGLGLVGILVLGYLIFGTSGSKTPDHTVTIHYGDVTQEVSITGRVKPVRAVDLAFEKSGRVQGVYHVVGDHVAQGELLADIESSAPLAALMEASARLDELKRGARPEEIAVKKAELAKYEQDLQNAYDSISDTTHEAFTSADDAVHIKTIGMFTGGLASTYRFSYQICDSQLDANAAGLRAAAEETLNGWRNETAAISATPHPEDLAQSLRQASTHLGVVRSFLEAVNRTLILDCTVNVSSLDTYRANINLARSTIAASIAQVNAKSQTISSLALSVATVKNQLSLLEAGTAAEQIAAQNARVLAAQGELRKYRLYAPISGTLTRADIKAGEFSNIATPVMAVISDNAFEIEANVPEADIAKISINNTARVTLDAYGSDVVFEGVVTAIDPAETIIDNVPTYKVTIHFTKDDERIKSGMTANIDIDTAKKTNVLVAPQRSLKAKDGTRVVVVVRPDGTTSEQVVTTGLRGSDGLTEITGGVSDGTVILQTPPEE